MALIASFQPLSMARGLTVRLRGPGGLYNTGNMLGFASSLALAMAAAPEGSSALAVADYFAGSASAITTAMVIFLVSGGGLSPGGGAGGTAGQGPEPPCGDQLSGVGAIAPFVGLLLVGEVALTFASGLLHAAGKFGSALHHPPIARLKRHHPDPFRSAVLASRLPAIVLLGLALAHALAAPVIVPAAALGPASLLVCYPIWVRADLLLFRS